MDDSFLHRSELAKATYDRTSGYFGNGTIIGSVMYFIFVYIIPNIHIISNQEFFADITDRARYQCPPASGTITMYLYL